MSKKQYSYEQAANELREILENIKEQNIDVDELTTKIKRAKELISICEKKIKQAEIEVKEIIETLSSEQKDSKE